MSILHLRRGASAKTGADRVRWMLESMCAATMIQFHRCKLQSVSPRVVTLKHRRGHSCVGMQGMAKRGSVMQ
eukprot:12429981-Ditylum_brightwellii.AAC.1